MATIDRLLQALTLAVLAVRAELRGLNLRERGDHEALDAAHSYEALAEEEAQGATELLDFKED